MVGQAFWFASFCGNDEDIGVPVVLAGESDMFSIGGKYRIDLGSFVRGEPMGIAAGFGDNPNVVGIDKGYLIGVNCWLPEETGLIGSGRVSEPDKYKPKQ
jgi:hypothetical protein